MKDKISSLRAQFEEELSIAASLEVLNSLRVGFLGKKGSLTSLLKELGKLSNDERPAMGQELNSLKEFILSSLAEKAKGIEDGLLRRHTAKGAFDFTLPGRTPRAGGKHPITKVMEKIVSIFAGLGFSIAEGPEVETDYYNFEALNIPRNHPSRDMQDTFYVSDEVVLRTHTSPVQIRVMEKQPPPVRIIAPGKVYRCDADVTHSPMFHQIEGLMVDEGINFNHLKAILEIFVHEFFGPKVGIRFRPSYFPFTEPSAEVDIQCVICSGSGCRVCSQTGWLEVLGAGMVDPAVFSFVHYDSEKWTGFAFGIGIERMAMLKYGIDDIRLFYENDLRFLDQFKHEEI
ncbi:MAG: phenylalanine--tRNA ligase subunit alpha [Nitrospinae bacterium]|nr:phenylalanine--tRNA ligase subunit alpha [Nitrospinota bacterium]